MLDGIVLVVLGALGAANVIVAKKPDAKGVIDKVVPYESWIGVAGGVWGAIAFLRCLLNLPVVRVAPLMWLSWLAASVLLVALGLLLGGPVFRSFFSSPKAQARLDAITVKLTPYRSQLGMAAMALGAVGILSGLLYGAR